MDLKLIDEVQEWVDRHPIEMDWDSGLDSEQVTLILEGEIDEVEDELYENHIDWIFSEEYDLLKYAIKELELNIEAGELREFVDVKVDTNMRGLIRNTRAYIAVGLGIDHYSYSREYEDVRQELRQLGINPHEVDDSWPDIPGRSPLVSVKSLLELWNNMTTDFGEWTALLDGKDTIETIAKDPEAITDRRLCLKAGAYVTIHSYYAGASSMIEPTIRDHPVKPSELYNDGGDKYGVQSCCGLVDYVWNGVLERRAK